MNKTEDGFWLLFWGVICAALSWLFWRSTGEWGFTIIGSIAIVGFFVDYAQLKKRVEQLESKFKD